MNGLALIFGSMVVDGSPPLGNTIPTLMRGLYAAAGATRGNPTLISGLLMELLSSAKQKIENKWGVVGRSSQGGGDNDRRGKREKRRKERERRIGKEENR